MTPDGLMSSLHGPYTGPTGDWAMWNDSGLDLKLRGIMGLQSRYYLYGDLAYWPAFGIMGPHRQQDPAVPFSRAEESANLVMSSARIAVEWGFALNIKTVRNPCPSKGSSSLG